MSEPRAIMGPIAVGMPGRETGNRPSPQLLSAAIRKTPCLTSQKWSITCASRGHRSTSSSRGSRFPLSGSGGFCVSGKMSSTRHFAPWPAVPKKARNGNAAKKTRWNLPKTFGTFLELLAALSISSHHLLSEGSYEEYLSRLTRIKKPRNRAVSGLSKR